MKSLVLVVAAIALTQTGPSAEARPKYLERFYETYSTQGNIAELEKFQCGVCHVNPRGRGTRTDYGNDFRGARRDFTSIENIDSDGDGVNNIDEIIAGTNPGDANSF